MLNKLETILLAQIKQSGKVALASMEERQDAVNAVLRALEVDIRFECLKDGALRMRKRKSTLVFEPNLHAMLSGSIYSRPAHASLSAAISNRTIEGQLFNEIKSALPEIASSTAGALVSLLLTGFWSLVDDDDLRLAAATCRKLKPSVRPIFGRLMGQAKVTEGPDAMTKVRQGLNTLPSLVFFAPHEEILARLTAGESPYAIAKSHGGSEGLRHLHNLNIDLVSKDNVAMVSMALEVAADMHSHHLMDAKEQHLWLSKLLPLLALNEPIAGFHHWIICNSYKDTATLQVQDMNVLMMWAQIKPDDFRTNLSLSKGTLKASVWLEGQANTQKEKKAAAERQKMAFVNYWPLPDVDVLNSSYRVKVVGDAQRLYELGNALQVCLAPLCMHFAEKAIAGERIYLEIHKLKKKVLKSGVEEITLDGDAGLLSVAEIETATKAIIQHKSKRNSEPAYAVVDALSEYLEGQKL